MRHTVAVDLDGVLADWNKGWQGIHVIGDPIPGAVEFTHELATFADVVIYTCRCSTELSRNGESAEYLQKIVKEWLDKHGFKYHEVYIGQGKIVASAYVDDRAILCRPQDTARYANIDCEPFQLALDGTRYLCGEAKKTDKINGETLD